MFNFTKALGVYTKPSFLKKVAFIGCCFLVGLSNITHAYSQSHKVSQTQSNPRRFSHNYSILGFLDYFGLSNRIQSGGKLSFADNKAGMIQYYNWLNNLPYLKGNEVFPIVAKVLPKNLTCFKYQLTIRKQIFIKTLLPLIVKANAEIILQRKQVLSLARTWKQKKVFTASEEHAFQTLLKQYLVPANLSRDLQLAALKFRVQPIPNSLVLCIAICETGWGRSRFLKEGNSLFSQVGYASKHQKVIFPRRRRSVDLGVRVYPNLYASIQSFMHNLNTHQVYQQFRYCRQHKNSVFELVKTLENYAEATDYQSRLKTIVVENSLTKYDKIKGWQTRVKPFYISFHTVRK